MIRARIQRGRIVVEEPIPPDWEGQSVKIIAMTPDDPMPDLDDRLAALHALGQMEYEPGEKDAIDVGLAELNAISKRPLCDGTESPQWAK